MCMYLLFAEFFYYIDCHFTCALFLKVERCKIDFDVCISFLRYVSQSPGAAAWSSTLISDNSLRRRSVTHVRMILSNKISFSKKLRSSIVSFFREIQNFMKNITSNIFIFVIQNILLYRREVSKIYIALSKLGKCQM